MATIPSDHPGVNGSARQLLRQKLQEHSALSSDPPSHTDRLISECIAAINHILAEAGCPPGLRAFIDSVIGAAHSKLKGEDRQATTLSGWFEASDLEIARAALGDRSGDLTADSLKKWTQRHRKALFDWQKRAGYTLIECEPGGQDEAKNNFPTRYRLPLLAATAAALREAHTDPAATTWTPCRSLASADHGVAAPSDAP